MRRRRRHPQHQGMSRFAAGLIAVGLIALATFVGFTKNNPFSAPFKLSAVFQSANNIKPGSPVRIAGVDVGKVKKVEAIAGGTGAARVEMEILDRGLPIHTDAELKIRPRIFLEGNFFVDVKPGSPSAEVLSDDDEPIPANQTAAPVQFGDLLAALQSDTRADLQVFLKEYSQGLAGKGARGFNQSFRNGEAAFKNAAIVNSASLGIDPTKDVQRLLKGQARTFRALVTDENALKDLVTNFNTTAAAFAQEDVALEASVPALRDTLRAGSPALASLNSALPSLRVFAVEALPGVRSSGPTLEASLPFIRQARALVSPEELQGAARQLRRHLPSMTLLNFRLIPFLKQARLLSSCTNQVLVPFAETPIPNPDEPGNTMQTPFAQGNRGFVGLGGESRRYDANQSYFSVSSVALAPRVRPAPPPDGGNQPPPRRPDVACETQEPPNLNAPSGTVEEVAATSSVTRSNFNFKPSAIDPAPLADAAKLLKEYDETIAPERAKRFQRELRKLAEQGGSR